MTKLEFLEAIKSFLKRFNPARAYRQRLRNIDHEVLFTAIRRKTKDELLQSQAILAHCLNDFAWNCNPEEYSTRDAELIIKCELYVAKPQNENS